MLPKCKIDWLWLRVETCSDNDIMFCDYCIKADVSADKSMIVKGCSSIRLASIKYHEASNAHIFAVKRHINEINPSEAPAAEAQLSLNKSLIPKLQYLFQTVHALNVKARPYSDYIWMIELDEGKGIQLGEKYRSAFACKGFAHAIADVSQKEISKYMASCKFLSVIVDGSCDSSITENEMVYIHTCVKGEVKTAFVNVVRFNMEQPLVLSMQYKNLLNQ